MADIPFSQPESPAPAAQDTFTETWRKGQKPMQWLSAVNNGPIGKRFLMTGFTFFLIGGIQALFMRLQLASPRNELMSPELYNQLFTMHGSTMLFLFVVPILEGLATLIAPTQLGTRDLPFPRLTAFAYWTYLFGGILMYSSFLFGLAPNGGWFAYVPLTGPEYSPDLNMDFWLLGLELAETSGIISAFELIIACLTMRAPGMRLSRMPVFMWAMLVTSSMILFAFMTVLIASLLLELDRKAGTQFFNPDLGGSPLLWQHLFWFFGHPEVYIQFLPAAGIIATVVPVFARRPLASYSAVVFAFLSIGFLSFGLWAHHMFTVGLPDITASFFSASSIVIAIPSGLLFFVLIATLWRGQIIWKTPMLFAAGFIVTFLIGGLSGVMVGVAPFDWQVHDSYFVVAHFHYVMIGGVVFPLLAGFYYWLPKITGRMLNETLGKWNFWLMFTGFNLAFFPMHLTGFLGMSRRIYTYQDDLGWNTLNMISTIGAFILALGTLLFLVNIVRSHTRGEQAGRNPWGASSLEWAVPSPPPPYGHRKLPIVESRYPLWEQENLETGDDTTREIIHLLERWPNRWQGAIVSDVLSGRIKEIFWLPNATHIPVVTALGLAIVFGALIFDIYWLSALGLVITLIAYLIWVWPDHRSDADHDPATEARFKELGVTVYTHSSPTIARWALLLKLSIAVVSLGVLLYSYFFLAVHTASWPDQVPPALEASLLALAMVLISNVFIFWGNHPQPLQTLRSALGFLLAFIFSVLAGVSQVYAYTRLGFSWHDSAYGSIFYLLAAFQIFMLLTVLVMHSLAITRLSLNKRPDETSWVQVSASNAALTHYLNSLIWLSIFFTLYLAPALL